MAVPQPSARRVPHPPRPHRRRRQVGPPPGGAVPLLVQDSARPAWWVARHGRFGVLVTNPRAAIAPSADAAEDLARRLIDDLSDPARAVLPAGDAFVEARLGAAFRTLLHEQGWVDDEPWTPLYRDLAEPVGDCGLRIQVVGPDHVQDRVQVQRAAFGGSTFTVERWHAMAAGSPYRWGRCLVGYVDPDGAVAAATVWSAGEGRPGLLEPMGVHPDHRGHGYGRAITIAATAALQDMGSSNAVVVAESSNTGAVATYTAAGFQAFPEVTDFRRHA